MDMKYARAEVYKVFINLLRVRHARGPRGGRETLPEHTFVLQYIISCYLISHKHQLYDTAAKFNFSSAIVSVVWHDTRENYAERVESWAQELNLNLSRSIFNSYKRWKLVTCVKGTIWLAVILVLITEDLSVWWHCIGTIGTGDDIRGILFLMPRFGKLIS